jgi:hypothetical protein
LNVKLVVHNVTGRIQKVKQRVETVFPKAGVAAKPPMAVCKLYDPLATLQADVPGGNFCTTV